LIYLSIDGGGLLVASVALMAAWASAMRVAGGIGATKP